MELSRQEYWSGLPFPSSGDLPNPGIKSWSPAIWATREALSYKNKTSLFIHPVHNSLCVLTPNPQALPPCRPSPLATTSLYSVLASLFPFHREVHGCHSWDFTSKRYHMVFVFTFLTFFTIISRSILEAANGYTIYSNFQWLSNIPLYVCTASSLSIHLSMDIWVVSVSYKHLFLKDMIILLLLRKILSEAKTQPKRFCVKGPGLLPWPHGWMGLSAGKSGG